MVIKLSPLKSADRQAEIGVGVVTITTSYHTGKVMKDTYRVKEDTDHSKSGTRVFEFGAHVVNIGSINGCSCESFRRGTCKHFECVRVIVGTPVSQYREGFA